jgi:hypothetical protein
MAYQTVTLATLRQELKDRYESSPFWTDTEALHAINESLRVWNMLTGMWKQTQTKSTTAGTVWYTFSSSFVYNMKVSFGSYPMEVGSVSSMNNGRATWQGETTTDGGEVPTRPTIWIPAGLRRLAIWPADAAGGNMLVVDGVCITPVLSANTDFIDLAQSEHDALLGEALHVLAFKEGGQRFEGTKEHHKLFLTAALKQNSRLSKSAYFRKALGLDLNRGERPLGVAPGL